MVESLLLLAYPSSQDQVLTSFRWASSYAPPARYTGDAKLTQISSVVNATHYSVIFRCQNCLQWSQGGTTGAAQTSQGTLVLGWCHDTNTPSNTACADTVSVRQHGAQGIFGATLNSAAVNPSYTAWTAKATSTVTGSCGGQRQQRR